MENVNLKSKISINNGFGYNTNFLLHPSENNSENSFTLISRMQYSESKISFGTNLNLNVSNNHYNVKSANINFIVKKYVHLMFKHFKNKQGK